MIDTIVLRIHNLSKYEQLSDQFYNPIKKKGSFTRAVVDHNTGEIKEIDSLSVVGFHDSSRVLPLVHRNTLHIASSHYSVSYTVNPGQGFLEFNLSIPKAEYSTNVFQFINYYNQDSFPTYLELKRFIRNFLSSYCLQIPIDEDIEVNRIDLCYNQFFNTKVEALAYLDEQKKLLSKYARSSKNNYESRDTSFMYVTRRYSFKVYHKGTEFAINDAKELSKNNPKNLPIDYLQQQADTVLRYEMTFRRPMIHYLTQHYFAVSKKEAVYTRYSNHPYPLFCRSIIGAGYVKVYNKYSQLTKMFCLSSLLDNYSKYPFELIVKQNTVTFDEYVFEILYNTFWDKVKQYQLSDTLNIESLQKRIMQHNSDNKVKNKIRSKKESGLNQSRVLLAAISIMQGFKVTDFKRLLPERTYYRLLKDLKDVGINERTTNLTMPLPRLDYTDYKIHLGQFH